MAKDAPYQFYLEPSLKAKGKKKSQDNNVPIAPFMVMAWEQFLVRPIEDSIRLLKAHNVRMKKLRKRQAAKAKEKLDKAKGAKVTL